MVVAIDATRPAEAPRDLDPAVGTQPLLQDGVPTDLSTIMLAGQGISTETYEQVVRQMLDHQHKIERRQRWWSGVAMCLPVVSSSILTVVMLLTGHGWGATVAPAAAGASAGVVLGRDQVKRRRGKSDPAAVPLAPQAAAT